jgi:hypothetical protein
VIPGAGVRAGAIEGAESGRGVKAPKAEGTTETAPTAPETEDWAAAPAREAETAWAKEEEGIEAERMTAINPECFIA